MEFMPYQVCVIYWAVDIVTAISLRCDWLVTFRLVPCKNVTGKDDCFGILVSALVKQLTGFWWNGLAQIS